MKGFLKYLTLFSVGSLLYMMIEILFRGRTHWTMGVLGGICFILIGLIDSYFDLPLYKQMLMGSLIVTALEFALGILLNGYLHLAIWDYSHIPLNIMGQTSLLFSFFWFLLCLPAIILDDWIRTAFFGEPMPRYRFF